MLGTGATTEDWRSILGHWHGLAVSVPVGLLVAVVAAEFIAFVQRDAGSRLLRTALWLCLALAAAAAVLTGLLLGDGIGDGSGSGSTSATRHTVLGLALAGVLVAVAVADVALPRRARALAAGIRVSGLGAATGLLAIVALLGVTMADGPEAIRAATPPRLRGLLAPVEQLATRTPAAEADDVPVLARPVPSAPASPRPEPQPRSLELVLDLAELDADAMLEILRVAPVARELLVRGRARDPIALAALPAFPRVRSVRLDDSSVDDAAASTILLRTPAAREVLLHGSAVGPASLPALLALDQLERVSVWDTALDTAAVRARALDQRPLLTWIGTPPTSVGP